MLQSHYFAEDYIGSCRGRFPVLRTSVRLTFRFGPRVLVHRDLDLQGLSLRLVGDDQLKLLEQLPQFGL
jgi:hypothetical protein